MITKLISISKPLIAASLFIFSTVIAAEEQVNVEVIENAFGWISKNCIAIKNDRLESNANLLVVELDEQSGKPKQATITASISRPAKNSHECAPLKSDRREVNVSSGYSFYVLSSEKPIKLGVGLVSNKAASKDLEKLVQSLSQNTRKIIYHSCFTSEGIQFSVWEGEAYQSKLIWSGYYYVGYDTDANCPDLPLHLQSKE